MTHRERPVDRDLLAALRRLADEAVVPPPDPSREAALLVAFDAARRQRRSPPARAAYRWVAAALAAAAALLIAVGIGRAPQRHTRPGVLPSHPVAVGEFVPWPGARDLPPLESGELLRVDLPVSMLPALGMVPPATRRTVVKADVIVGQDGLARAVRLVGD
jgi:hypothetical protein